MGSNALLISLLMAHSYIAKLSTNAHFIGCSYPIISLVLRKKFTSPRTRLEWVKISVHGFWGFLTLAHARTCNDRNNFVRAGMYNSTVENYLEMINRPVLHIINNCNCIVIVIAIFNQGVIFSGALDKHNIDRTTNKQNKQTYKTHNKKTSYK